MTEPVPHYLRNRPSNFEKWKYIRKYKMDRGCQECGYNKDPAALDLDHLDRSEKRGCLADAIYWRWEAIHEELAKCIVLCANCHRIKTMREKETRQKDWTEEDECNPQMDLL